MARKRLPGFQPADGVFEEVIKPYRSWYERSEMSPLFEVNQQYYRVITTIQYWRNVSGRKMLVCDEKGKLIDDENITYECLNILIYLARFIDFQHNDDFYIKGGEAVRHEPTINAMNTVKASIDSKCTEYQLQGIEKHRSYLYEHYRLSVELMNITKQKLSDREIIENSMNKKLTSGFIQEFIQHLITFIDLSEHFEVNLIENREGRKITKEVLTDQTIMGGLDLNKEIKLIIGEINGSQEAVSRAIENNPEYKQFDSEEEWIASKKKSGNEKKYVADFTDTMVKENWVLSPHCIYLKK
ncbi:hypothetical protein ACE1TF_05830 [Geomicrobium sp. JSM 1781026]|uniref:hypothetical protein n=1 Tax=Geomicrobium sp. JSM 1781026 TaxID=3344580 RepID=UPI0035C26611